MKLISQISKESDTPIGTIRFYEKMGLFSGVKQTGKTTNNYVYYTDEVIGKLNFIKDAKETGFTLAEIKEVIDAWYGNKMTKEEKLAVFDKKLQQLDEKIKELRNVKKQIAICKKDVIEGRE
jgi:MerR family transcriptional regulator, copper efflux regulator